MKWVTPMSLETTNPKKHQNKVEYFLVFLLSKNGYFPYDKLWRFYQPYFDVTTEDVKNRILATIDPRKNEFLEMLQGRPDL